MKNSHLFITLFLVMTLSSCTTMPVNQPLSPEEKASVHATHVVVNTTQHNIVLKQNNMFSDRFPDPYAPMDSGAVVHPIGGRVLSSGAPAADFLANVMVATVNYNQEKNAASTMSSVNHALNSLDYFKIFNHQLESNLKTVSWLKIKKQETRYNIEDDADDVVLANKEDATLLIGTTYALNSTFKQLEVSAYVVLMKKLSGASKTKTLYENNFYFIDRLSNPSSNKLANRDRWLLNDGSMLKQELTTAASLLPSMIANDITKTHGLTHDTKNKIVEFYNIDGAKTRGDVLKNKNGNMIIACVSSDASNGNLYAIKPEMVLGD